MDPVADHRYERALGSKPLGFEGFFRALLSGRLLPPARLGSLPHGAQERAHRKPQAQTTARDEHQARENRAGEVL